VCHDVGRVTLVDESKGDTIETARGCPSCGKVSKYIVLGCDDEERACA
jgi:hypothetical protein